MSQMKPLMITEHVKSQTEEQYEKYCRVYSSVFEELIANSFDEFAAECSADEIAWREAYADT